MMTNKKHYILLAHLPFDPTSPEFTGDWALLPCEWTIYEEKEVPRMLAIAEKYRTLYRSVQIREISPDEVLPA